MTPTPTDSGRPPSGPGSRPSDGANSTVVSTVPASIPNAPWWRCIHCGCDEYKEHVFTGHMKGVPMVHCANCEALHSPPNPDSKTALRWQISELAMALEELLAYSNPRTNPAYTMARAALDAIAMETRRAETPQSGSVAKP